MGIGLKTAAGVVLVFRCRLRHLSATLHDWEGRSVSLQDCLRSDWMDTFDLCVVGGQRRKTLKS